MTSQLSDLRERLEAAGQAHVLAFEHELDEAARSNLHRELEALDLDLLRELAGMFDTPASEGAAPSFGPPGTFPLRRDADQEREAQEAVAKGRELLAAGKIGYILVAGGQGSRLGLDGPKGLFPVGPVSQRVLFDFHARRLLAARETYGTAVHWYVMTSQANDAETRAAFDRAGFYGLDPDSVHFFSQEMLPALSTDGKILMKDKSSLFLAPNGHGGSLWALKQSGCLEHAKAQGLEHLSYFQVDNPLARPADPLFLGLHKLRGAEMSSKVVPKRDAAEKVGVIGTIDGKFGCIEYSDLSDELLHQTDEKGELVFKDGNIAVHVIDVDFVDRLTRDGLKLPWHLARKKMKVIDESGRPTEVEGGKFETFVFDALSQSRTSVTLEVQRELEFSPVKNAEGSDSPATTRRDLCRLFASWVEAAGLEKPGTDPEGNHPIEVDPVFAEHLEDFVARKPSQAEGGEHLYD